MKKLIVCLCANLIIATAFSSKIASADEVGAVNEESRLENYVSSVYRMIDFKNSEMLPYDVFSKAVKGYLNLRNASKLSSDKQVITICDLAMPSTFNRMWIIDLGSKKVLFNTYVAHGQGSGEDCSLTFSNRNSTHMSSLGFYVTKDTYQGEHGTSLHLDGMDEGFNDAAMERGIVVHGADYVGDRYLQGKERLGRSWGCPAVSNALSLPIIEAIKGGTCLFIYYPERHYLNTAYWLNKRVTNVPMPEINPFGSAAPTDMPLPKAKYRTVQYMTNGKIDSVKNIPLVQS